MTAPLEVAYLTTAELAAMLRTTPAAIYNMRSRGDAPKSFKRGRERLTALAEVRAWERARTA